MTKRCGIVAIIGEPNVGKSTLLNRLVGDKISIVSPKVQTTRFAVRGIALQGNAQIIFVDTPGIFTAGKAFEKTMVKAAWSGIGDADAVLLLIDAKQGLREESRRIIEKLGKGSEKAAKKKYIILAINKIDSVKKEILFNLARTCDAYGLFSRIFMISALQGDGVEDVKCALAKEMPEGPWLYPDDQTGDMSMRLLAAEITREKIFLRLHQELPYAISVETEAWQETPRSVHISQVILVEREGQKKIIIGKGGAMLKNIGIAARKELSAMLDKSVHLELFVKIKPDWKRHYNQEIG